MDSASTLSKHNSAVYESADVAAINQAIGAYNDQKPNLMKSMYPPNPVIESVEDEDGEGSATSEPMSPESQAMHDRNVEAAQEVYEAEMRKTYGDAVYEAQYKAQLDGLFARAAAAWRRRVGRRDHSD